MTLEVVTAQPNPLRTTDRDSRVSVIIVLEGESLVEAGAEGLGRVAYQLILTARQAQIAKQITEAPFYAEIIRTTQTVLNSITAIVNRDSLALLQELTGVHSVTVDQTMFPDGSIRSVPSGDEMRQPFERPTTVNE